MAGEGDGSPLSPSPPHLAGGLTESLSRLTLGKRDWTAASDELRSIGDGAVSIANAVQGAVPARLRKKNRRSADGYGGDEPMAFGDYCEQLHGGFAEADGMMMNCDIEKDSAPRQTGGCSSGADDSRSRLLSTILRGNMKPLQSSVHDQEASLLRQSYIAPEQNSMQIILHPEAASACRSGSAVPSRTEADTRAMFRAMRAGFLLSNGKENAFSSRGTVSAPGPGAGSNIPSIDEMEDVEGPSSSSEEMVARASSFELLQSDHMAD